MLSAGQSKIRVRYSDIEEDLRKRILAGEFADGCALPGEIPLSKSYSASRKTVRKALEQLCNQNFISKSRGLGNFVIPAAERDKMPRITERIRVMIPEEGLRQDFCSEVVAGIQKYAAVNGVAVTLGSVSETTASLTEQYRNFQCDAFLWCSVPEEKLSTVKTLAGLHIPQVVIGNSIPGAGAVFYDSLPAWHSLLFMLHNAGHSNAAFLERAQGAEWSSKRQQAMKNAARKLDMNCTILNAEPGDQNALENFMREHAEINAFVAISPWTEAFRNVLDKMSMQIPEDFSFAEMTAAGVDNDSQITRIYIPSQGMGFAAAEMLATHDFRKDPAPVREIGCFTVAGLSTGVVNKESRLVS